MRELLVGRFARRLVVGFAVVALGAAALTAVLVNVAFRSRFQAYVGEQRTAREQALVGVLASVYGSRDAWVPTVLDQLAPTIAMAGSEVAIADTSGRRVWSLADAQVGAAALAMHRRMMGVGPLGPQRAVPVTVAGRRVGTALLRVPRALVPTADRRLLDSVNRTLVAGSLAAGLLAAAVGAVMARRTSRPVLAVADAARGWAAGARERRAAFAGEDEVAELARAVNTMADTVAREDGVRREFTAAVAHELRTPLAVLRSQLEAAQDGIRRLDGELVASLHDETLRLTRLVEDLETLTAADAAGFALRCSPVEVAGLVKVAAQASAGRFGQAGLRLRLDTEPVVVEADPDRLAQVLANLFANAVKFVPAGGTVIVRVHGEQGQARVTVADDGPGIEEAALPHVFDRFYRGPGAKASGSGIGLAVVAELVAAHGGRVAAGNVPGGGARFDVWLPAAPDAHAVFTAGSQPRPSVAPVNG